MTCILILLDWLMTDTLMLWTHSLSSHLSPSCSSSNSCLLHSPINDHSISCLPYSLPLLPSYPHSSLTPTNAHSLCPYLSSPLSYSFLILILFMLPSKLIPSPFSILHPFPCSSSHSPSLNASIVPHSPILPQHSHILSASWTSFLCSKCDH